MNQAFLPQLLMNQAFFPQLLMNQAYSQQLLKNQAFFHLLMNQAWLQQKHPSQGLSTNVRLNAKQLQMPCVLRVLNVFPPKLPPLRLVELQPGLELHIFGPGRRP
jgi:hypothetical protein